MHVVGFLCGTVILLETVLAKTHSLNSHSTNNHYSKLRALKDMRKIIQRAESQFRERKCAIKQCKNIFLVIFNFFFMFQLGIYKIKCLTSHISLLLINFSSSRCFVKVLTISCLLQSNLTYMKRILHMVPVKIITLKSSYNGSKLTNTIMTQCQIVCTKRVHCVSKILTPRRMLQKT